MMRKIWLIGIVVATAVFSGCYYCGPCLNGSGPVIAELRDVGVFTGVSNTGSFDLFVIRADSFSVEVIAQENLMPIIETYVSGYMLIVKTENDACYRSSSPVQVVVTMPETETLRLTGSGKVFADMAAGTEVEISNSGSGYMEIDSVMAERYVLCNSGSGHISAKVLDGTKMDVALSGSGRIELAGDVEVADYLLNSSGRIDALDLMASDVDATSTGSGKVYLWATDFLDATITGSGDIIYRGDPMVTTRITGTGSIRSY